MAYLWSRSEMPRKVRIPAANEEALLSATFHRLVVCRAGTGQQSKCSGNRNGEEGACCLHE